jgi:hypothetical protein
VHDHHCGGSQDGVAANDLPSQDALRVTRVHFMEKATAGKYMGAARPSTLPGARADQHQLQSAERKSSDHEIGGHFAIIQPQGLSRTLGNRPSKLNPGRQFSVSLSRFRGLPGEPARGVLRQETWHCGCWRRIPLRRPLPMRLPDRRR